MSFYNNLKTTASTLLKDKGQLVVFSREVQSAFNPTTGVITSSTTTFSGYGAAFNYSRNEINNTIIENGDIKLTVEAMSTAPIIGDSVTIDAIAYRVMNVQPLSPSGIVVKYDLQLRR